MITIFKNDFSLRGGEVCPEVGRLRAEGAGFSRAFAGGVGGRAPPDPLQR